MALNTIVYGIKHNNEDIRAASRSGGFFTAVTDVVLNNGGVVYGCALNDSFLAEHRRAETKAERDLFRGSKYIQSNIGDSFKDVKNDLISGKTVLFSGTPCQIEGLVNFLKVSRTDLSKLITIDILCHGVPSPMVWSDYLNAVAGVESIEAVDFRDKANFGWRAHIETLTINGEQKSSDKFKKLFFSHLILRPSCFNCHYKNTQRISDITIGDYWRIEDNDKDFDDDKGVSLVMINTAKGRAYFDKCKKDLIVNEYPLSKSIQPVLSKNYPEPKNRAAFWQEYKNDNFMQLIDQYIVPPLPTRKQKINSILFKILRIAKVIK